MHHLIHENFDVVQRYLDNLVEIGSTEALYLKGYCLLNGYAYPTNKEEANSYFKRAADKNFPPALASLGDSYLEGDGVKKDPLEALICYEKASKLGYGPAQFNVGILFMRGKLVPKDLDKAEIYLRMAKDNPTLGDLQQDATAYYNEVLALKERA